MYNTGEVISQGSHDGTPDGDEINGDTSGGISAYQAALNDQNATNKMATVKLVEAYSGSDINATNIPTLAHLTMPDGAVVYKTAVKMAQKEYKFEEEARDKDNQTYDAIESMINNDAHGIVAHSSANHNRRIVFANNQNYTDTNSSGIVVEIDTTNAPDIFVSNPNAGTWSVVRDADIDGGNADIVIVHITAPNYEDEYVALVYDCFDVGDTGSATSTVWRGRYRPTGRSEYEYRFNDIANATLLNAAIPVTPQEWMDMNLSQDINSTDFDNFGVGVRTFDNLGDMYELEIEREQNGSLKYELDDMEYGRDGNANNFVNRMYVNGVLEESETHTFTIDANVSAVFDDGSGPIYKTKIVAVLDANATKALFGINVPEGAETYKVAGLCLVDSAEFYEDARIMATNGTEYRYDSLEAMINDTHLDNNKSFDTRSDGNNTYALAFSDDSNLSDGSGDLCEVLVGDTNATAAGTWTKESINGEDVITIHPINSAYEDDIVFAMDGEVHVQRGEVERAGTGGIEYYTNPTAKDVIQANFENGEMTFYYSYFYGQTRYFVNQNNITGYRNFALNYTFEGEVNGGAVAGNYMIQPFNLVLENTGDGKHLVFVHIGETPDGEGEMFSLTINGGQPIYTSMYRDADTRDHHVAP